MIDKNKLIDAMAREYLIIRERAGAQYSELETLSKHDKEHVMDIADGLLACLCKELPDPPIDLVNGIETDAKIYNQLKEIAKT